MILGDIIKKYRTENNLSMDEFSKRCGLSKAYISILERNCNPVNDKQPIPSLETIKAVSSAVGMDFNGVIALLDGKQPVELSSTIPPGFQPLPEMVKVPLIGHIACGEPITAEENLEGRVGVPSQWGTDFALLCKGDSMLPTFQDGDVVCIHKQPIVENGQVAAVRIDCEATLKRVYFYPDRIVLQPENPSFSPIVKVKEEMNEVSIEGKVVGLCRRV